MCGFLVLIRHNGHPIDLGECRLATNLLRHRGPDAYGEWVDPRQDVFLGFRRLSIIDLSTASSQPMVGESGKVLVFNGEIYNFQDLRRELKALGCHFKSSGDTEVLLKALETWGTQCLTRMEGMFAFVLWDPSKRQASISRDFFGIKPLYLWEIPQGGLAVASEVKAFYALKDFVPELDRETLPEYLRFRSICGERTLFRGVRQVQPGQLLRYDLQKGLLKSSFYWRAEDALHSTGTVKVSRDKFLELFRQTVERHLIADVPVGTQFSGGIDSGLICAVAVRDLKKNLVGFHCEVSEAEFNETPYAVGMAKLLGIEMQKTKIGAEEFCSDLLENLTWHMDEPLGHPNAMGVNLISRLAKGHVKVLLSGEVADELFAGYTHYSRLLFEDWFRQSPSIFAKLAGQCKLELGRLNSWIDLIAQSHSITADETIVSGTKFMADEDIGDLLGNDHILAKSIQMRRSLVPVNYSLDLLTRCQIFDLKTYLPPLLVRQDKMSMAASIENRVPFATPSIFKFAMSLPPDNRATPFNQKKVFLKSCLRNYFPRRYVVRKKWGFGFPLAKWLGGKFGSERLSYLCSSNSPISNIVDTKSVEKMVNTINIDPIKSETLWILFSLAVWYDIFINRNHQKFINEAKDDKNIPSYSKAS